MLTRAVAYLASPVVGVIAGGIAMSFAVPGPAAMFSIAYAAFGASLAIVATLVVGLPAVALLRRIGKPLLPWLLLPAIAGALLFVLLLQCALATAGCGDTPPVHNLVFAVVSAVVTALLLCLLSRENAL